MPSTLERTQVYLPRDLKRRLKQRARVRRCSFSEVLRGYVEEKVQQEEEKHPKVNAAANLLRMALKSEEEGLTGPSDLSVNHDYYLYVEPYENKKRK